MSFLEAVEAFQRVAEQQSFTSAANSLGVSRSSISRVIKDLEDQLGTRLLQRTTRSVKLTADGEIFYQRSQLLLSDLGQLKGLFQQGDHALSGRIRVDVPLPMAQETIIPQLSQLTDKYPKLQIELSSTDRLVDLVREGFDCVVRVGFLEDSNLVAKSLGAYPMVNCASSNYLARHGTPQSLEDLREHQLIHYAQPLGAYGPAFEYLAPDGSGNELELKMPSKIAVNSTVSYLGACLAHMGIIQTPKMGVAEHLRSGILQEVLPEYLPAPLPVSLLYPNRKNIPKRVKVFMQWLGDKVQQRLLQDSL